MVVRMQAGPPAGRAAAGRMSGAERREQLLDVARAIVSRSGFSAISMEAVARAAGVTRPVVYEHFDRLDNLLEALVDRESGRALAQLTATRPRRTPGGDPREDLVTSFRAYLEAVEAEPETWRLVLLPPDGAPERLRELITTGRSWNLGHLSELVAPGVAPGAESPDPALTARLLSHVAEESARLLLTNPAEHPVERHIAHARWALAMIGTGPSSP